MKKATIVALICFSGLTIFDANGQESIWGFSYMPATPVGDLREFANATSWRGWSFEGRRFMTDEVSLGGFIGYNGFYEERPRQLYDIENTTVNAITYRYVYTVPVLINAHYYIGEGWIRPYAGLGLGIYYTEQELQFSTTRIQERYWKFGFAPEAGLFVPFGIGATTGALINVKFHQIYYNEQNITNLNYINYNLGLAFSF